MLHTYSLKLQDSIVVFTFWKSVSSPNRTNKLKRGYKTWDFPLKIDVKMNHTFKCYEKTVLIIWRMYLDTIS